MLEEAPDVVRFEPDSLLACQQDLLTKDLVVFLWVLIPTAHLIALNEAVFLHGRVREHLEETRAFIVVGRVVVRQLDVDIGVGRSGRMHMMKTTFGHSKEDLMKLRSLDFTLDLVKVLNRHIISWRDHFRLKLL